MSLDLRQGVCTEGEAGIHSGKNSSLTASQKSGLPYCEGCLFLLPLSRSGLLVSIPDSLHIDDTKGCRNEGEAIPKPENEEELI